MPVEQVITIRTPDLSDSAHRSRGGKLIRLTASNADARTLLLTIAAQAGLNIMVSTDVKSRVSVNFHQVPAWDAIHAIIEQAGLSVSDRTLKAPWGPVIFRRSPVNLEYATVEEIARHFGVTMEMARFIVSTRSERFWKEK